MADFAGAEAAMRALFAANFAAHPVAYENEDPPVTPWPPASPFVIFEVIQTQSALRGVGLPGERVWLTQGHIFLHVMAPKGYGTPAHRAIAEAAGEIFRSATLYNADPGAKVVCGAPMQQGGVIDGNQYRITVAVPFDFYFIA